MKYFIAVILVTFALASAEPPRNGGYLARQQAQQQQPYPVRGSRPAGPAFNLPLRSQKQQLPPSPAASYGPPPQEYGPPAEPITELPTTTETIEATTSQPQAEKVRVASTNQRLTNAAQQKQVNPAAFYVVVPQSQNLIYASAPATSAKLVAQVQQPRLLPVQAVPAFAKIQEVPQFAQLVEYQSVAPVATVPVASSAYTSVVNTPYSSTFVQSFQ